MAKAKALVAEVGTIPTIPYTYSSNPLVEATAAIVQANLAEVGIPVELDPVDGAQFVKQLIGAQVPRDLDDVPLLGAVHAVHPDGQRLPVQRPQERLAVRLDRLHRATRTPPGRSPTARPPRRSPRTRRCPTTCSTACSWSRSRSCSRSGPGRTSCRASAYTKRSELQLTDAWVAGDPSMTRYLLRRLPSALAVLFAASIVIFAILRLVPGDPATTLAGPDASPEAIAAIRHELGLDQPVVLQYLSWLGHVLTVDLGRSYLIGGQISDLVRTGLINTVVLAGAATLLAVAASLVTALLWVRTEPGRRRDADRAQHAGPRAADLRHRRAARGGVRHRLPGAADRRHPAGRVHRPPGHRGPVPAPARGLPGAAGVGLADPLPDRGAAHRARGAVRRHRPRGRRPARRILRGHALPAALPTYLTALGIQAGALLGGAVLVEAVFNWPGLGQLAAHAIDSRDYPVVQVLLLLSVAVFVVVQLVTDLVHAYLDPRIRIGGLT